MARYSTLITVFVLCFTVSAQAGEVDFSLNDYSVEAEVRHTTSEDSYGSSEFNIRGLYNSKDEVKLASIGIDAFGMPGGMEGLKLGVGGKVYGADYREAEILALALGALIRLAPDAFHGFSISAGAYYAPNVLSGLDAERLVETWVRIDYEIIPRARVFIDYNKTITDIENQTYDTPDEGVRAGLVLGF